MEVRRLTEPERPARVHLGLVCLTSPGCPPRISYRKVQLARATPESLRLAYRANVATLRRALTYCRRDLHTRLYRMPSGLLPWLDAPPGELREWADAAFAEVAPDLRAVGEEFCRGPALRLDDAPGEQPIRVTSHPDQFCVLNSERPDVVQSSIRMLAAEARVMDAMGLQRSPWAGINIHGGARDRLAELRAAVNALPDAVRSRLTLENCERAYSVPDLCAVGVPVVFDPHHEVVRSGCGLDSEHLVAHADLAMATWPDPCPPLAHLSNGLTGPRDRRHNDFISHVFPSLRRFHWIDVEAKGKELAIRALRAMPGWWR